MALVPVDFVADVLSDITSWLGQNIAIIGGLLALAAAIGFVARMIRKSRKGVESKGGKI